MYFLKKTINNMFITLTNSDCKPIFLALMVELKYLLKNVEDLPKRLRINYFFY
jgi:hypothetical protein